MKIMMMVADATEERNKKTSDDGDADGCFERKEKRS